MLKRVAHLTATSLAFSFCLACAEGSDDTSSTFGTFSTTQTTSADDSTPNDTETGDSVGDGDGDPSGDGDPTTTGDGDGDPTTTGDGDGDPTTTGDGDGDPTTTGDGDGDPGPDCGNGALDPGETCDGNNFGGVTCVDLGFDQGALTCTNCAVSTASCMNAPQPGLGQLYSNCLDSSGCPGLDACATVTMMGEVDPFDGYCTNFCASNNDCAANTGGTAVPQCNDAMPDPYCELDCAGNKTCPQGMVCTSLQGGKKLCY